VMPSSGEVSLPVNADIEDDAGAARMLDALRLQFVPPVLGLPGLAVPVAPVDGLPMGVQIISRRYREDVCLDAGEVIETHFSACTPIDPRF
jgi:amidase